MYGNKIINLCIETTIYMYEGDDFNGMSVMHVFSEYYKAIFMYFRI